MNKEKLKEWGWKIWKFLTVYLGLTLKNMLILLALLAFLGYLWVSRQKALDEVARLKQVEVSQNEKLEAFGRTLQDQNDSIATAQAAGAAYQKRVEEYEAKAGDASKQMQGQFDATRTIAPAPCRAASDWNVTRNQQLNKVWRKRK